MKTLLTALLVSAAWLTHAQDSGEICTYQTPEKKFKKLDKLYLKQNFEGLAKKAEKMRGSNPKDGEPLYFLTLAHYHLAEDADTYSSRHRHSVKAFQSYVKGLKRDPGNGYIARDKAMGQTIRNMYRDLIVYSLESGKSSKARYYAKNLARFLADTVDNYAELFPPATPVVEEKKVEKAVATGPRNINRFGTRYVQPATAANRTDIVSFGKRFVGTRYKWGGEAPGGFDCSGFVLYVYRNFGYDFNHSSREIAKIGTTVDSAQVQAGDIAFFGTRSSNGSYKISHMGMIASAEPGKWQVIHATNKGVLVDDLYGRAYWTRKLLFIKNIIDVTF